MASVPFQFDQMFIAAADNLENVIYGEPLSNIQMSEDISNMADVLNEDLVDEIKCPVCYGYI